MTQHALILGQRAYDTYVQALAMDHLCTFHDLAPEMQRVWACVEAASQGRPLLPAATDVARNGATQEHMP